MSDHKEGQGPWWNDSDMVGGLAATVVLLGLVVLILALMVRVAVWIWP